MDSLVSRIFNRNIWDHPVINSKSNKLFIWNCFRSNKIYILYFVKNRVSTYTAKKYIQTKWLFDFKKKNVH